jgi:hypothetical protein
MITKFQFSPGLGYTLLRREDEGKIMSFSDKLCKIILDTLH